VVGLGHAEQRILRRDRRDGGVLCTGGVCLAAHMVQPARCGCVGSLRHTGQRVSCAGGRGLGSAVHGSMASPGAAGGMSNITEFE